jgi:hypothetical protein
VTICSTPTATGMRDVGCAGNPTDYIVMWFAFEVKGMFTASASSATVMSLYRTAEASMDEYRLKCVEFR